MKISILQRRPFHGQFSVEGYFARLAQELRTMGHEAEQCIVPRLSQGLTPRLHNLLYARKVDGDIVHIAGDIHYTALGCKPKRTVLTILDCATLERLRGWRLAIFRHFWFTAPMRRCAAITVISHATMRMLLEKFPGFDERKIRVIYVSISDSFHFSPKAFNAECPRILQVGTKGNKNLTRMFAALKGIPCRLVVVGSMTPEEIRSLDRVGLSYENPKGLSEAQLVDEYRKCDIVTFASTMEGFGMPIVEGQKVGRPVLTSNISSMPEIAGQGACLIDPHDVESIHHGFRSIIGNPGYREELIRLGRENCRRFESHEIATRFEQLYSEVDRSSSV